MSLSTTLTSTLSTFALAGALMFAGAGAANAKGPKDGARQGHGNKMARVCKAVECTEDQRAAVAKIQQEAREDAAPHREAAKKARQALKAAFAKDNLDKAEVTRLWSELDAAQAAVKAEKREAKMQMHEVLTSEQREKLAELREKRGEKGKDKAKRGKGKGKGKDKAKAKAKRGKGKGKDKRHANKGKGPRGNG